MDSHSLLRPLVRDMETASKTHQRFRLALVAFSVRSFWETQTSREEEMAASNPVPSPLRPPRRIGMVNGHPSPSKRAMSTDRGKLKLSAYGPMNRCVGYPTFAAR